MKSNWNNNKILALENKAGEVVFWKELVFQAVEFFEDTISSPSSSGHFDLNSIHCPVIPQHLVSILEEPINPAVILKNLKSMKMNKAPGSDGFIVKFFLETWEIVGDDFCKAILYFFNNQEMYPGINATSIALIPKVPNPIHMKDFRSISLCSIAYKCIAKILGNRLKIVLPHIINVAQSAFVRGRSITNNILMAQELLQGYGRETESAKCALKIDLHKAFDSIS